jgi:hypothetical protein
VPTGQGQSKFLSSCTFSLMAIKQEIEQGKKASINILHNKDNNQLILEIIKKHSLQPTM